MALRLPWSTRASERKDAHHAADGWTNEQLELFEGAVRGRPSTRPGDSLTPPPSARDIPAERRWSWRQWGGSLRQDLAVGSRFLRAHPTFTMVTGLVLALGVGLNTAVFSVTYAALLKPLSYPDAERLVEIRARRVGTRPLETRLLAIPAVEDIVSQSGVLDRAAYSIDSVFSLTGRAEPESLRGQEVSGELFSTYGVPAALGRVVRPSDTVPGHEQVVVLSHQLWQRAFGADPAVVGQTIQLAIQPAMAIAPWVPPAKAYTVIGVMPPRGRFPVSGELWVPLKQAVHAPRMGTSPRAFRQFAVLARLKEGVTLARANEALHTIARRLAAAYPDTDKDWDFWCLSLQHALTEPYRAALALLLGAVNVVLLLACASVSSLLVAKSRARQRDVAIRSTLGATRVRLVQQRLCEAMMLSGIGGVLAVAVALASVALLRAYAPPGTPNLDQIRLDWPVLLYMLGMAVLSGVLLGLAPAIQLTRPELNTAMKEDTAARRLSYPLPFRPRGVLIGLQIALAFPLVVGAVLTLRSLDRLLHVQLGFRHEQVLSLQVKLSASQCAKFSACTASVAQMLDQIRTIPGVRDTAVSGTRPLSQPLMLRLTVEDEAEAMAAGALPTQFQVVTPDYFRTLGIPLRDGRWFTNDDTKKSPLVAVVNQTLANQRLGGGGRAASGTGTATGIGKRLSLSTSRKEWYEVVGIVSDVRDVSPARAAQPTLYLALNQANLIPSLSVLVRAPADPVSLAGSIRHRIRLIDKDATISELKTLDEVLADAVATPGFQTSMLSVFAALALLIALLSIHGLVSYAVSARIHEFGVRLALGAQPRDVVLLVLREGLPALGVGVALGIAAALGLTRFLRHLLFEIQPTDVTTLVCVAVLMLTVGLFAYYLPARRAIRVAPLTVLRID